MFLSFLLNAVYCTVLSIDLGSEYYKMAQSSLSSEPQMVLNSNSVVPTSTAIAFRSSKNISKPIDPESIFKYQIRFGNQAIPLLKKNSSLGFRYLNRLIGRENKTEFYTSNLANVTELFAISLHNLVGKHSYTDGISFVIPQFWTNEQRVAISSACNIVDLPVLTIVDDFTAISLLYGSLRNNKYRKSPKHILFVDVGSTSCKAYGAKFVWKKDSTSVYQTSAFWSEKCGGYYLSKLLSQSKNLSFKKASKLLQHSDTKEFLPYINDVLEELKRIISDAMLLSNKTSGPFDEVQVTGGASQYKFIVDTILSTTMLPKIQRDFNANEAYALGGVIAGLQSSDISIYSPVHVNRLPMFTINVTCGNATENYCIKNDKCTDYIVLNSTGCKTVQLLSPQEEVPEGTINLVAEYELVNISNFSPLEDQQSQGILSMTSPDALVDKIIWCANQSEANCYPIDNHPYFRHKKEQELSKLWASTYIEILKSKQRKAKLLEKVDSQLKLLKQMILPKEGAPPNVNVFSVGEPYKDVFMERLEEYNSGKMHNWDEGEVLGAQEDLEEIMKNLVKQM
ncbi:hypothetical protein M9Y10_032854 [Tritrichomonas musculus]|uniref:DnaK protein n=1 Tax=Tritrichomonas musculus TaxID=1915356 RepID=A0ABR2GY09_9EUKA